MLWRMVSWSEVEKAEPEFAAKVRGLFDAHKHKTIATLRADGSPRISGIEAEFADGELTFGSMPRARKGADLHRDPRFALHSATTDPPDAIPSDWPGEAKIAGRAYTVKAARRGGRAGGRAVPGRPRRGGVHGAERLGDAAGGRVLAPRPRAAPGRADVTRVERYAQAGQAELGVVGGRAPSSALVRTAPAGS